MLPEFVRRGRDLNERGAHLEAVKVCRLGLLAHPSQLEGRLLLGAALLALGRYDEVLAEMRVALELDGLNGTALTLKGEALLGRGDHRQALDVLEKAARYDAANDRVDLLIAHAREGAASGGPPGLGDADTSISWTRNYPGFRPSSEATLDPDSQRTTLPGDEATTIAAVEPLDLFANADTVLGDATEIEDESLSTMEIDPEVEGVEILPSGEVRLADLAFGGPTVPDVRDIGDEPSMELGSSDLIPAMPELEPPKATDDVRGFDDGFGSNASDPTHGYRGRPGAFDEPYTTPEDGSLDFEPPLFLDSDPDRVKSASFPTDLPRPSHRAAPPRPPPPPPPPMDGGPVLDELFPDDEDGVSKLELIDEETGLPRSLDKQPHHGQRPPPAALVPGRGEDTRERRRNADMRMIREGLGLSGDPSNAAMPRPAAPQPPPSGVPPRPRMRNAPPTSVVAQRQGSVRGSGPRLSVMAVVILAAVLLGGGVAGGVVLRGWRTERQLDAAAARARELLETGNYRDHLRAAVLLDRALDLRDRGSLRALRARVEVATADEFGVAGKAAEMVEALGDDDSRDAAVARAELALFRGDLERASAMIDKLDERFAGEPIAVYLRGRASLERGQLEPAKAAFEKVHEPGSTPLITARLAEIHRLSGQFAAALALAGTSDLPSLAIARARAMAGAGELESTSAPEDELEALIADGLLPPAKQTIGVSPRQLALARLAVVEVSLARGKPAAARPQLAELAAVEARDGPFIAAYAEALVAAGDSAAARDALRKLAELWPQNPRTAVLEARLALRGGDTRAARAAIDSIKSPERIPQALAVRGELALEAGRLSDAIKDLDAAIAANPGLVDASLARARVDLAQGNPRAALERLDKLPAAFSRERDIVRARAFRQSGSVERARKLLDKLAESGFVPALLEMARIEHKSGKFTRALATYKRILEIEPTNPIAALEQANLTFEEGDPKGADKQLDALAGARPNDARVLLASARIKSLMGDPGTAEELIDKAAKVAGPPQWLVDRERGRSLLRRQKFDEATRALEAASEASPTDGETWLLLMEVHVRARNPEAAAAVLKKATMPLENNSYVLPLLRGMEAIPADQLERSLRDFQTAAVLVKGTSTKFERARLLYWQGRAYEALGDLGRARLSLSTAVKLDPRHADAYLMLGEVEFQDQKQRAAIDNYVKSAQLDPVANPKVHFYLGELYLKDRRFKAAVASLEQYIELVPTGELSDEARRMLDQARAN